MALPLSLEAFQKALQQHLSPTTPIRSAEHLRGRERKLEDIRRSFVQPGRHIFIYGDRGVGKTSLAQTAGFEHHPSSLGTPIFLGCDSGSTFFRVAHELASRLDHLEPGVTKQVDQRKAGISRWGISGEAQRSVERSPVPEPTSVNEAVGAIAHLLGKTERVPVVIVDEFERILDNAERALFADFIKQAGDQSLGLRLIFCGVGAALGQLLDTHHSCYRYLTAVQLERLPISPLLEIIDGASEAVGAKIDDTTRYRIARISDGFPHYVHLIVEKLLWEVFESPQAEMCVRPDHYSSAIRAAVIDIEPHLKSLYEKATLKYSDDYEAILWAIADHHELKRRSADIYDAYVRVAGLAGRTAMPRDRFNARMNSLKKASHGPMLTATRQGWYEFHEAVVRGYVRLRAEERGIRLGSDHPLEVRSPTRVRGMPGFVH